MKEENNQDYENFFISCRDGKINNVKKYFKIEFINGIKVNGKCRENPLSLSLRRNYKNVVSFLLKNGADPNYKLSLRDKYFIPILNKYIEDRVDDVSNEYFIMTDEGHAETDLDKINSDILKILEDIDLLKELVNFKADFNKYDSQQGFTALDFCYENNHIPAYNFLVNLGALHSKFFLNLYAKNDDNLKYLLDHKKYLETEKDIKPYIPNIHQVIIQDISNFNKFNSPLEINFLKSFIKDDTNINEKDYLERTALDCAIELGHHLAVDYLKSIGGKTSKELEEKNDI